MFPHRQICVACEDEDYAIEDLAYVGYVPGELEAHLEMGKKVYAYIRSLKHVIMVSAPPSTNDIKTTSRCEAEAFWIAEEEIAEQNVADRDMAEEDMVQVRGKTAGTRASARLQAKKAGKGNAA